MNQFKTSKLIHVSLDTSLENYYCTMFSACEIKGAAMALILYHKLGQLSKAQFQHALKHSQLNNCPITINDAK
jgi:hypothetical protein